MFTLKIGLENIVTELNEKLTDQHDKHESHDDHIHVKHHTLVKAMNEESKCFTITNLAKIYNLNNESLISKENFTEISSSLVWIALYNDCDEHENNNNKNVCNYSTAQSELFLILICKRIKNYKCCLFKNIYLDLSQCL